jgi:hypothetical protein
MTPTTPPTSPNTIDAGYVSELPQSAGTKLPTVPPAAAHNQMTLRSMRGASA